MSEINYVKNLRDFLASEASAGLFAAVLGRPIKQSLSPLIHNAAFRHHQLPVIYHALLVDDHDLDLMSDLFRHPNFSGANITLPLKQDVIRYLDNTTDIVDETKACNTVFRSPEGKIIGDNTDVYGFTSPLIPLQERLAGMDAIVFGSGGAARAAIKGLNQLGINGMYVVSRNPGSISEVGVQPVSYSSWREVTPDVAIFVNASPLGMFPNTSESPVLPDQITFLAGKICYDLIYRPSPTRFLRDAAQVGATVIDGVEMFVGQASRAFERFTNLKFPEEHARGLVRSYLRDETSGLYDR